MITFWDLLLITLVGALVVVVYSFFSRRRKRTKVLFALWLYFMQALDRILYIISTECGAGISQGSIPFEMLESLMNEYLQMSDWNDDRKRACVRIHDSIYQVAIHLNVPAGERAAYIKGTEQAAALPSYRFARAFALDKYEKLVSDLKTFACCLPLYYKLKNKIVGESFIDEINELTKKYTTMTHVQLDKLLRFDPCIDIKEGQKKNGSP